MDVLRDAELIDDLHAAAARGVVFAGMSAGAIMLGERWIRWPRADAGDDEAETYECLGAGAVLARHARRRRRLARDALVRGRARARARQQSQGVRRAERRRARDRQLMAKCAHAASPCPCSRRCRAGHAKMEETLAADDMSYSTSHWRRVGDETRPHGGRGAAVSRSARAAGRSAPRRPMARAGAAPSASASCAAVFRSRSCASTRTCTPRCTTSRSRCSRRRARRPIGCR